MKLALLALAPLLAIAAVLAAGEMLSASCPAPVGDAPADLHASTIRIATPDGFVAGSLAPAHVNLHAFAPDEYEQRVGAFFAAHLRMPSL